MKLIFVHFCFQTHYNPFPPYKRDPKGFSCKRVTSGVSYPCKQSTGLAKKTTCPRVGVRVFPWISINIVAHEPFCLGVRYPLVMKCQTIVPGSKPLHYFLAFYHGGFSREDHSVRRIFPIAEVFHKPMFLRVLVVLSHV